MKGFIHFSFALLIFMLSGCFSPEKNYIANVKLLHLTQETMYNADMVYDVIFDAEEQNIDSLRNKSQKLFLEGIDAYKNQNDIPKALILFKNSILTFPNAKTYYEYGNARLDAYRGNKSELEEAEKAFNIAERLGFQPSSMVYYKHACIYAIQNNESVNWAIKRAIDEGFTDTTLLATDNHLKNYRATANYELTRKYLLQKLIDNPVNLFDTYKRSFALLNLPFEIMVDKVAMNDYSQSISYDFSDFVPEMQTSSFSRETSHDFQFVGKVAETVYYTALLYTSVNYFGEEMQPVHTKIVTYNNQGDIISSLLFAGQFGAANIKTGKIDGNEITVQDYKRIWKKPIDEVSFEENSVEKYEPVSKAVFKIDDLGKIIEESVPDNYKDSVVYAKE